MSQNSVWSGHYDQLDPQRRRVREEIRQQALRDATAATEAVRATLRSDLARARRAQTAGSVRGSKSQRAKDSG